VRLEFDPGQFDRTALSAQFVQCGLSAVVEVDAGKKSLNVLGMRDGP
jgi:hypothetical protein